MTTLFQVFSRFQGSFAHAKCEAPASAALLTTMSRVVRQAETEGTTHEVFEVSEDAPGDINKALRDLNASLTVC